MAFEGRLARTSLRCRQHVAKAVQRDWKHSVPHESCKIEAGGACVQLANFLFAIRWRLFPTSGPRPAASQHNADGEPWHRKKG